MSGELTKEQLLDYVKKQKIKIKKLEADLASAGKSNLVLEPCRTCDTFKNELKSLKDILETLQADKDSLYAANSNLQDELKVQLDCVLNLQEKLQAEVSRNSVQTKDLLQINTQLNELIRSSAEKDIRLSALMSLDQSAIQTTADNLSLKNQIESLTSELSLLKLNLSGVEESLRTKEAQILELRSECVEAKTSAAAAEESGRARLNERENELKQDVAAAERECEQLKQQLTQKEQQHFDAVEALQKDFKQQIALVEDLRSELQVEKEKASTTTQPSEDLLTLTNDLRRERAEALDKVSALQLELQQQLTDTITLEPPGSTTTNNTSSSVNANGGASGGSKKNGKNKKNKPNNTNDPPAAPAGSLINLSGDSERVTLLTQQIEELQSRLASAEVVAANRQQQVDALTDRVKQSEDNFNIREAELVQLSDELKRQLIELNLEAEQLRASVLEWRSSTESANLQIASLSGDLSASVAGNASLQDCIDSQKAQLDLLRAELTAACSNQSEETQILRSQTKQLQLLLEETQRDRESALSSSQQLSDEVASLLIKLDSAVKAVSDLKDSNEHKSKLLAHLEVALADSKALCSAAVVDQQTLVEQLTLRGTSLQQEVDQLRSQVTHSDSLLAESAAQLEESKQSLAASESKGKKLTAMLKTKMKEIADLQQSSATSADTLNDKEVQLQGTIESLHREVKQLTGRETQLSDRNTSLEEKISSLLKEKNSLQEELFRFDFVQKELKATVEDRDDLRRRFLMIESKLTTSEAANAETIQSLNRQLKESANKCDLLIKDSSSRCDSLQSDNKQLRDSRDSAEEEVRRLRLLSAELPAVQSSLKQQQELTESLKNQLKEEAARFETQSEKLKKVQLLLKKVNTMSQEKDSKMSSLLLASERPKRFHVMSRLTLLLTPMQAPDSALDWCYILEDTPPGESAAAPSKYRWVEKSTADSWVSEGSTVISDWPQSMNDSFAAQFNSMREQLQTERDDLKATLEDLNQQFSTYKQRAQAALKRIGNEENKERQKAQEAAAEQELHRVSSELTDAQDRINELLVELSDLQQIIQQRDGQILELRSECVEAKTSAAAAEESGRARLNERENELRQDVAAAERECEQLKQQLTQKEQQHFDAVEDLEAKISLLEVSVKDAEAGKTVTVEKESTPSTAAVSAAVVTVPAPIEIPHQSSVAAAPLAPELVTSPTAVTIQSPRSPQEGAAATDKLLLYQQADFTLKQGIVSLRRENSQLTLEIIDLKSDLGLRDDQIAALKDTIRELEATILREREFNAGNRRINADYLVNILRKFLLSSQPSERSKLVPVLCNILQFQPEDTRAITSLWTVKASGGLVGWLMPVGGSTDVRSLKSSGGDVTYDPVTGGGIDINTY